jgi:uncharacterized protein
MLEPIAGLLMGLAGSMHCAGMCGPIAMALPRGDGGASALIAGRLAYNLGRVATYTVMGAVIGLGGSAISLAGYGHDLSLLAGITMIIMAIVQLLLHRSVHTPAWLLRLTSPLRTRLGRLLQHRSVAALFGIGLLNGILPCGMVTAALVGAAGTGNVSDAMLFMASFGIGTTPMMAAIALGAPLATQRLRATFRTAAPVVALVMGCVILVRGMGLGIPFLSPVEPTPLEKAACCSGH